MSSATRADTTLPAVPESVAYARAMVDAVEPPLAADSRQCARLLVSEVFSNAIRHGTGTAVSVRVVRRGDALCVSVHDDGPGFLPQPQAPDPECGSGWGLQFVARFASRWGVDDERGTTVWFELDVAGEAAPQVRDYERRAVTPAVVL